MFWPGCIGMAVIRTALAPQWIGYFSAPPVVLIVLAGCKDCKSTPAPRASPPSFFVIPGRLQLAGNLLCCFSRKAVQRWVIAFRPPQGTRVLPVSYCLL